MYGYTDYDDYDITEDADPNIAELDALLAWAETENDKQEKGLPSEWDQGTWASRVSYLSCGSACCIAGKAVARQGGVFKFTEGVSYAYMAVMPTSPEPQPIEDTARRILGITQSQADALFNSNNDIDDVRTCIAQIKDGVIWPETKNTDD